jgi:hypothetical protein
LPDRSNLSRNLDPDGARTVVASTLVPPSVTRRQHDDFNVRRLKAAVFPADFLRHRSVGGKIIGPVPIERVTRQSTAAV